MNARIETLKIKQMFICFFHHLIAWRGLGPFKCLSKAGPGRTGPAPGRNRAGTGTFYDKIYYVYYKKQCFLHKISKKIIKNYIKICFRQLFDCFKAFLIVFRDFLGIPYFACILSVSLSFWPPALSGAG